MVGWGFGLVDLSERGEGEGMGRDGREEMRGCCAVLHIHTCLSICSGLGLPYACCKAVRKRRFFIALSFLMLRTAAFFLSLRTSLPGRIGPYLSLQEAVSYS